MKKIVFIFISFLFLFNSNIYALNLDKNEILDLISKLEKLKIIFVQDGDFVQKIDKLELILKESIGEKNIKNESKENIKNKILKEKLFSVLQYGINDKYAKGDVKKLQEFLKSLGYEIYPDGWFGNETLKAVKDFNLKYLGQDYNFFDPREFFDFKEKDIFPVREYLDYGEIDFAFLNFNFPKKDILSIECNDKEVKYFFENNKVIFPIIGSSNKQSCYLKLKNNLRIKILEIYHRDKKRSVIRVNLIKKYASKPNPELLKRIKEEKYFLKNIYSKAKKEKLFNSSFIKPLDTKIISPFGKTRIFNDGRKSVHSGTDFRARTPLPVKAINDGEVILANKDLYYCGKSVIINHGLGIFSIYCHLSKNDVKTGDKVKKGQIIGLTGATGRVSGPHLHLGVKFNSNYIDFESLLTNSQKIKNR